TSRNAKADLPAGQLNSIVVPVIDVQGHRANALDGDPVGVALELTGAPAVGPQNLKGEFLFVESAYLHFLTLNRVGLGQDRARVNDARRVVGIRLFQLALVTDLDRLESEIGSNSKPAHPRHHHIPEQTEMPELPFTQVIAKDADDEEERQQTRNTCDPVPG